ncbi:hypothetical protein GQ55_7G203900 [Panicum hallii var. hallii]|uniref:Uncharacterized protein n=1 Tax=Panicum hallii var. hallii TaxID=1504633 RepID=A0A2T7CX60_9POAL|nr:hypothetical protein GQ55_7G203900 [Panicum hallii var. hallii]
MKLSSPQYVLFILIQILYIRNTRSHYILTKKIAGQMPLPQLKCKKSSLINNQNQNTNQKARNLLLRLTRPNQQTSNSKVAGRQYGKDQILGQFLKDHDARRSMGRPVVAVGAVEGLHGGEQEQEHSSDDGDDRPRVAKVVVLQAGHPRAPLVLVVPVHLVRQPGEVAVVDVEHHLVAEAVEEVGHLSVAAEPVLDDAAVVQVLDVLRRVDEVVHEDGVGGDVVAARGGDVHVALLERDQVQEQRLGAVVDEDPRDLEHAAVELDVPEPVCVAPPAPNAGLPELRHAVHELLPPLVGHAAQAGPLLEPQPRGGRRHGLQAGAQEAAPEHVEAVEHGVGQRVERRRGLGADGRLQLGPVLAEQRRVGGHERVEEPHGQAGDGAGLLRVAELDPEQEVEHEERDLVLEQDHVVAHGVHRAAHGEDGVVPRVPQVVDEPLPTVQRAAEELQHEGPVQDEALGELIAPHPGGAALVAGAHPVLQRPHGAEVRRDVVARALEHVVQRAPLVAVHLPQAAPAVVERADGDHLRRVGALVAVAEAPGNAVHGEARPGARRLLGARLRQLPADGDHPFRVLRLGAVRRGLRPVLLRLALERRRRRRWRGAVLERQRQAPRPLLLLRRGFLEVGVDGLPELDGDEVPAQHVLVEDGDHRWRRDGEARLGSAGRRGVAVRRLVSSRGRQVRLVLGPGRSERGEGARQGNDVLMVIRMWMCASLCLPLRLC